MDSGEYAKYKSQRMLEITKVLATTSEGQSGLLAQANAPIVFGLAWLIAEQEETNELLRKFLESSTTN